jgi:hypothetical protein
MTTTTTTTTTTRFEMEWHLVSRFGKDATRENFCSLPNITMIITKRL